MISARGMKRAAWAAKRIISTAPIAKFGAMKTGTPRSFAARVDPLELLAWRPVVPTTAGTPCSTAASTLRGDRVRLGEVDDRVVAGERNLVADLDPA